MEASNAPLGRTALRKARRRRVLRNKARRMAAAATATAALVIPPALAGVAGLSTLPGTGSEDRDATYAFGDLLTKLRGYPGDLGAGGHLAQNDTISPTLLDALRDPGQLSDDPFAELPEGGTLGIPGTVLDAYMRADRTLQATMPGCGLHWSVLAGIGRIESRHANSAVDLRGNTIGRILGPVLNGAPGMAAIADTDGGRLDGDTAWDRAVGPMQFIPSTWALYAADGDSDGTSNPHNVYDAALASGKYLCAGGLNLLDPGQLVQAVFRYNHSNVYVQKVLLWAAAYATGVNPLPTNPVPLDVLAQGAPPVPNPAPQPPPGPDPTVPPPNPDPTSQQPTTTSVTPTNPWTTTSAKPIPTTSSSRPITTTTPSCTTTTTPTSTTTTTTPPKPTTSTSVPSTSPCVTPGAPTSKAEPGPAKTSTPR
ncbi:lytic transglycosylase domain-containing protein [Allokutzneria albata]|uniref:Membrane-bound lytic murein transglycosylase B n=1 Tax=Allokutzneria albata TaxID=211114 RepID=A0A1G9YQM0_ALLAB|nr:lytic murein transglycosylase [Allokutzneria albata]SDN11287.1 Membrane-bound lytic murein transglycosylase B [Allokutzneria albata]